MKELIIKEKAINIDERHVGRYDGYEEAVEAALKHVLKKLI